MALSPSRTRDAWRITAVPLEPTLRPIQAAVVDDRLVLRAADVGSVISLVDPDTGATLLVGTQRRNGQGVPVLRQSAEFTLLPTWQGVAVEPNADTIALRPTPQGFMVAGAFTLSPSSDIADLLVGSAGLTRHFDFPSQPTAILLRNMRRQVTEAAAAAPLARGPYRQTVARTMIALGLGAEAGAMLNMAATDDPHEAGSPDSMALASIAALLAHRPDEANGLIDPRLPATDDIALWRAVRLAQLSPGSAPAAAMFAVTLPLLLTYPSEIRDRLLPLAAETLVAGGEIATAAALLDARKDDAALDLARAMLQEAKGDSAWSIGRLRPAGTVTGPVVARPRRRPRGGTEACRGCDRREAGRRTAGRSAVFLARRSPGARAARTSGRAQGTHRRMALRACPASRQRDAVPGRQGRDPWRTHRHVCRAAARRHGGLACAAGAGVGGGGERRPAPCRPRRRCLAGETGRSAGSARSAEARRAGAGETDEGSDHGRRAGRFRRAAGSTSAARERYGRSNGSARCIRCGRSPGGAGGAPNPAGRRRRCAAWR